MSPTASIRLSFPESSWTPRREILTSRPLSPGLRRPAAVQVALHAAWTPWIAATLGTLAVVSLAVHVGTGPWDILGGLIFWAPLVYLLVREMRIVRAATVAGAVPRVAEDA